MGSILERLISAFQSRNLRDRRAALQDRRGTECDVQRIAAAGLAAARKPLAMAVFELRYRTPADGSGVRRDEFMAVVHELSAEILAHNRREGWRLRHGDAERVTIATLLWWLLATCPACDGRRYETVPGTPMLSDRECSICGGRGKPALYQAIDGPRRAALLVPAEWLAARLDDLEGRAGDEYIRRIGRHFTPEENYAPDPWGAWD